MYTLNYYDNGMDCGYCYESEDLNELKREAKELINCADNLASMFEDFYAQLWIEDSDGKEILQLMQWGATE